MSDYWIRRKDLIYYQVVRVLAVELAKDATSVLDVGSRGCPMLDWFPAVEHRTSLDLLEPYVTPSVQSIELDFLLWAPDRFYDLVLCLQVLEEVSDAQAFAKKLLASGKQAIISVPYKWREGKTPSHIHDPVDEAKLLAWFGREPSFQYICKEVASGKERMICVYDSIPQTWSSLRKRAAILAGSSLRAPKAHAAKSLRRFSLRTNAMQLYYAMGTVGECDNDENHNRRVSFLLFADSVRCLLVACLTLFTRNSRAQPKTHATLPG